jgi:hypothetical protein
VWALTPYVLVNRQRIMNSPSTFSSKNNTDQKVYIGRGRTMICLFIFYSSVFDMEMGNSIGIELECNSVRVPLLGYSLYYEGCSKSND